MKSRHKKALPPHHNVEEQSRHIKCTILLSSRYRHGPPRTCPEPNATLLRLSGSETGHGLGHQRVCWAVEHLPSCCNMGLDRISNQKEDKGRLEEPDLHWQSRPTQLWRVRKATSQRELTQTKAFS